MHNETVSSDRLLGGGVFREAGLVLQGLRRLLFSSLFFETIDVLGILF